MKQIFAAIAAASLATGCGASTAGDTTSAATEGTSTASVAPPTVASSVETEAPAVDTTAPAEETGGDVGTRENPVPLGQSADVGGGWTLTVNSVNLNANDEVAAANEFNEPPPDGDVYVVVNITATFNGEGSDTAGVDIAALGEGTNAVSGAGTSEKYAVAPDPIYDGFVEVFSGGTTEGNVVLEVPTADIDTLVLIGQSFLSFNDSDRKFFAVS